MALFNPNTRALVSSFAMQAAAGSANGDRNARYRKKIAAGYRGPVIVAEGDSWLCYPQPTELVLPILKAAPRDLVLTLSDRFAVYTEAVPGDTAWGMLQTADTDHGVKGAIRAQRPDVVLVSAGGNDLLGAGRLETTLVRGPKPKIDDYFGSAFEETFETVVDRHAQLVRKILAADQTIQVVVHCYSYAQVTGPGRGPWLFEPMTRLGIPASQHNGIVKAIVDRFYKALVASAKEHNVVDSRVTVVDTRKVVASNQWFDELHPDDDGFAAVAKVIAAAVSKVAPAIV